MDVVFVNKILIEILIVLINKVLYKKLVYEHSARHSSLSLWKIKTVMEINSYSYLLISRLMNEWGIMGIL